jgi:hypothetical protein
VATNYPPNMPTWEDYFARVGNEELLTAKALLTIDPHVDAVRRDAERWLRYSDTYYYRDEQSGTMRYDPVLDWDDWVNDVDTRGRGWSSGEWRMYDLVAGLTTGRPFNIVGVLDRMGSWKADVWRILTQWGTEY